MKSADLTEKVLDILLATRALKSRSGRMVGVALSFADQELTWTTKPQSQRHLLSIELPH